jgi:hypothetical protein
MKNIHLLPTDKPSRLYKSKITQNISMGPIDISQHGDATYNLIIYITSDEEIKEGDYGLIGKEVGKIILTEDGYEFLIGKGVSYEYGDYHSLQKVCKKIILTTDQDLIADGVQAINNEFLEWFVKNPSCEEVEVVKEMYMPQSNGKISDGKITHELSLNESLNTLPFYRIIIPQEKPKQDPTLENAKLVLREYLLTNKEKVTKDLQEMREKSGTSKDETLEEAAERTYQKGLQDDIDLSFYDGVRLGAKYQSEKMYSEEELKSAIEISVAKALGVMSFTINEESFEQFKKKQHIK